MSAQVARPYQQELHEAVRDAIRRGFRRILLQLPTGGGKTFIGTRFMLGCESKSNYSMFMAPRRELVYQTAERLMSCGVLPGVIMAGEPINYHRKSQVASFDSLYSRVVKQKNMELPPAKVLVVDEAHLTTADTRVQLMAEYPGAIIIGLSATPAGPNGKPLKEVYDHLITGWSTRQMMDEGYLVEAKYVAPSEPDLKKVKLDENGDYQQKQLSGLMNKPQIVGNIVENWLLHASDRSTVVFCVSRAHAKSVCEQFVNRGVAAEYVDGETPTEKRKAIFKRVASGATQVLVNVFVASYGLDIPVLDCVVLARPTKSLVLYLQMVGRALRPVYADGFDLETTAGRLAAIAASRKPDALVIDHTGSVMRLGFVDDYVPWTLEGNETIEVEKQKAQADKSEPKQIMCPRCKGVIKGKRFCPSCGFELVTPGEDIPTHEAVLVEIKPTDGKIANRNTPWPDKIEFYAQALGHAQKKGHAKGAAAHLYREKFGVWPNDQRLQSVAAKPPGDMVKGFLKHRAIKKRFSR